MGEKPLSVLMVQLQKMHGGLLQDTFNTHGSFLGVVQGNIMMMQIPLILQKSLLLPAFLE